MMCALYEIFSSKLINQCEFKGTEIFYPTLRTTTRPLITDQTMTDEIRHSTPKSLSRISRFKKLPRQGRKLQPRSSR